MSHRAQELAERFAQTAGAFAAEMERLTPEQWASVCPDEGRTVAALAYHVAEAMPFEMRAFRAIARGDRVEPVRWDVLNESNARRGELLAACDQAETAALVRRNAAAAAATVRGFSDEQLARTGVYLAGDQAETVETHLERYLIGHIEGHLASIRAALGAERR